MEKPRNNYLLGIVLMIVWGYIGGQAAKSKEVKCDFGVTGFCLKWHKGLIARLENEEFSGDLINGNG